MKKMQMRRNSGVTFEEGCEMYIENCKKRNLREGTINHYRQSFTQFFKYFERDMPVCEFDSKLYDGYVLHLKEALNNDVSINSYLRDLITTLHFLMNEGYVTPFKMTAIKVDKSGIETYTDLELQILLQKPNIKKCKYVEYQAWVMTNFLFCTGVRQRSLINIRVCDIDFENGIIHVNVTKTENRLLFRSICLCS